MKSSIMTVILLTISLIADAQSIPAPVITKYNSTKTSITLTWTESASNNGWYRVYYGKASGNYSKSSDKAPTTKGGSTATISRLTTNTAYYLAVRYFVSGSNVASSLSNEVVVRTGNPSPTSY
jgi:hypothetical protein